MRRLIRSSPGVSLAAGTALLLLVAVPWLLAGRLGRVWDPALVLVEPDPLAAAVPPPPSIPGPPVRDRGPRGAVEAPAERYALEIGPLSSADAADHLEDQLSDLGYATVRFRTQDATRVYVLAASGFASVEEARLAARHLGRGAVVEAAGAAKVVIDRIPSLDDAVKAARPLQAQGFEVRVSETVRPRVTYHVRYGQFASRTEAQTVRDELAGNGIKSRVIRVR